MPDIPNVSEPDDEQYRAAVERLRQMAMTELIESDRPLDEVLAAVDWMSGHTSVAPAWVTEREAADPTSGR